MARIMFRVKIHEAKGQAFEDLFVKIYQRFANIHSGKTAGTNRRSEK